MGQFSFISFETTWSNGLKPLAHFLDGHISSGIFLKDAFLKLSLFGKYIIDFHTVCLHSHCAK